MTTELRDLLQASFGEAYVLEREFGGGGMSRVFLARETGLGRHVVIKVLPPELSGGVSGERFRREIQLAAQLQHPHIVPVLTAGVATGVRGGVPYFTMPFLAGESLRARLARDGPLPVAEALRVLHDVASALAFAHARGVVHRDIKPENVLLSGGGDDAFAGSIADRAGGGGALVTDFGVAKAIAGARGEGRGVRGESAAGSPLTTSGFVLGTPAYMAPEQVAADPATDHRADIYAFGILAYELLSGAPPFAGRSPRAILAAQVAEAPAPVSKRRADVPTGLATLIMRCLEKDPARRPQSAAEVLRALEDVMRAPQPSQVAASRRRLIAAGALAALALAAVGVFVARSRRPTAVAIDENTVAVVPFRVTEADSAFAYLREGMIDLLAAKLTGEGGPRAVDPRSVMSTWRRLAARSSSDQSELTKEAALGLARQLGAGQLLLGSVVVGPTKQLTISATVFLVSDGRQKAHADVAGSPDSLSTLTDRLTASLLTMQSGRADQWLAGVNDVSLPVLRAYLEGQAAYRRGRYREAVSSFEHALEPDSTFALAAVGLASAGYLYTSRDPQPWVRGRRLAWEARTRLSERDRAYVTALVGATYPAPTPAADVLSAWEHAVQLAPDRPEAWYELGDVLFHMGSVIGADTAYHRAAAAFGRALELDSTFALALEHLVELNARTGDTAQLRQLASLYLSQDSSADIVDFVRWRVAVALRDREALAALRRRFPEMAIPSLDRIIGTAQLEGVDMEDAVLAADALAGRGASASERETVYSRLVVLALNRGRPREAVAATDGLLAQAGERGLHLGLRLRILGALYAGGDSEVAADAALRLAALVAAARPRTPAERAMREADVCAVEQWRVTNGDARETARAIAQLRAEPAMFDVGTPLGGNAACPAILDALLAVTQRRADAAAAVDRLDSLMRRGPIEAEPAVGNLLVARFRERQGDAPGALRALRRQPNYFSPRGTLLLSTFLYEEGRLAAVVGDRADAVRAYRHYLALRSDPEPSLAPEVVRARAILARLGGN